MADTNVLISALIFGGLPGIFLEIAFRGSISLVTSAVLLDELNEKLRFKFKIAADDAKLIRNKIESVAELITPVTILDIVADDPDDNRVLECAVAGRANFIVSGDRHLLKLVSYESIPISTVRQFLNLIGQG